MSGLNASQMRALQQMFQQQGQKDDGLVTFRAGRLFMDDRSKVVTADKKRGKIKLLKDEQGLLKFQWFNRISNQKELDLTIFPQSATWQKVSECKDGRVFVLRMTGSNRKHFFWSQEPKEDKDDEWCKNINTLCSGGSIGDEKAGAATTNTAAAAANPYAALGGNAAASQNSMAQMILNALNQSGNNAAASGAGGAPTGASGAAGAAAGQPDLMAQMAQMMRQQQSAALEEMKREPDLEDILDVNANPEIAALLDDEKVVEELAQHLPESMRSRSDLLDQLQSPQFQGSLRRLQSAINGPQMPTLLQGMGRAVPGGGNAMGVTAFVNAIQPDAGPEKEKEKSDGDGDAEMEDKDKDKKDKEKDDKGKESAGDMYK